MARMVATKAALSIRVDALTDADGKSEPSAPSIGLENRAKLESRLRALEQGADAAGIRGSQVGRKQQRFQMSGETKTYNDAADDADLVSTQREPTDVAAQAALSVKEEKRKAKEARRAQKKAAAAEADERADEENDADGMSVDGEVKGGKEKKRKRRESAADGEDSQPKAVVSSSVGGEILHIDYLIQEREETEEERKARKKARKAEKAAALEAAQVNGDATSSKKKRKKSEAQ